MGSEAKLVEVVHQGAIRPSSPTPHHLRVFSLSTFDQFSPAIYFPLILFYPNVSGDHDHGVNNIDHQCLVVERIKLLKRSLSEALTLFYPFAGRIQDNVSVCCNDQGVMFLEAQVKCPLSRVLEKPDIWFLKELMPVPLESTDQGFTGCDVLLVQANSFECGGIAIGFSISHKMIDAYTLSTFLNCWAEISLGLSTTDREGIPQHQYVGAASLFPPMEVFKPPPPFVKLAKENCTTRRFVFESSKIASLKSKIASAAVQNPTRVEAVSALIWKCAIEASSTANSDSVRPSSAWFQTVNMRKVLAQPSTENLMGNLLGFFAPKSTRAENCDSDDDLQGLVVKMRKGLEELKVNFATNGVSVDDVSKLLKEYGELLQKDDVESYCCTSWCRLPFYEANFGWGRPWMSIPATTDIKNLITLMDTRDGGGIEARVTLKDKDMAIFEKNDDLLAYASLNVSVL